MFWENPTNEGLKLTPMKVKGNRWATSLTADVLKILNHAEKAEAEGFPIKYINPQWSVIYQDPKGIPFIDPLVDAQRTHLHSTSILHFTPGNPRNLRANIMYSF